MLLLLSLMNPNPYYVCSSFPGHMAFHQVHGSVMGVLMSI
jgi:hypothetical protein